MRKESSDKFTSKGLSIKLWKRLLPYAFKNKTNTVITLIALCVTSVVDVAYSLMFKQAIDRYVASGLDGFGLYVLGYVLLIVTQGIGVAVYVILGNRMEITMNYHLRKDMFYHLQNLSFSYYDKVSVGHIMARVISDVANIGEVLVWTMIRMVLCVVYIVGILSVMFALNLKLTLLELTLVPVMILICTFFGRKMLKYQRKVREHNSNITGAYNECIMGAVTTKTLVREEKNEEEFWEETHKMKRATMQFATVQFIFMPLVVVVGALGTAIALYQGGHDVSVKGIMEYGTLALFISSMSMLFESLQDISQSFADLQGTQASAERVLELLDTPIDVKDTPEIEQMYGDSFNPKYECFPKIHGDVEFRNVSFKYKGGEEVLHNFNLKVKSGQTIALVGETGAGKSTIINLMCRFYEPTEGEILIDGTDYRERSLAWLQSDLGYVLQQPHLFSGTIRDNIAFGKRDATDEEIERAAKSVHAHEFITKLKNGYDTETGEGGNILSTGQKQLISFARAILKNPSIFVLDEATSSIDTETEQLIQSAITNIIEDRTSFIVAHRLSTIRNADRILVIRNGMITEDGTHEELMDLHGYYYDLYTNQFKEERLRDAMK